METALDILHKQDCKGYCEGPVYGDSYYENEEIVQAMILFAQMHVTAALQKASEQAKMLVQPSEMEEWENVPDEITRTDVDDEDSGCEDFSITIDKDSILNSYSLKNIK
jgi:hypothetical protein